MDNAKAARQRDEATRAALEDSARAERLARAIDVPWYRCQALAWAARYAPSDHVAVERARAAFEAAADGEDAFRQVAVSAWPIRALVERGLTDVALELLEIAVTALPRVTPASSRAEAISLLLQAAFATSRDVRRSLAYALAELHDEDPHWRVGRALEDAIAMLREHDSDFAERLRSGSGVRDRRDENGEPARAEPRTFFVH